MEICHLPELFLAFVFPELRQTQNFVTQKQWVIETVTAFSGHIRRACCPLFEWNTRERQTGRCNAKLFQTESQTERSSVVASSFRGGSVSCWGLCSAAEDLKCKSKDGVINSVSHLKSLITSINRNLCQSRFLQTVLAAVGHRPRRLLHL